MNVPSGFPSLRRALALAGAAAGLVALLLITGCGRSSSQEIKVGVLVLQGRGAANAPTGGAAATSSAGGPAAPPAGIADRFGLRGLALALEELNAGAGSSRPVRLVTVPSDGEAQHAVAAFRKLVETERVPVVIAALTSTEVLACAPFANQTKTVLLTTMATSADVRTAGDYVFRDIASTSASAEVLAAAMARRFPHLKSTIFYPDLEFGLSLRDGLQAALAERGAPVAETILYSSRRSDPKLTVDRLAQITTPVIVLLGSGGEIVQILKLARERGVKAQFVLGGDLSSDALVKAGPAAEGVIAAVEGFDPEGAAPHTKRFIAAYRSRYEAVPSGFNAATYDALKLVGSLLRRGAASGEELRAALYSAHGYQGVDGSEVVFDADGEGGTPPRLVEVRDGKLQPLR